jgi:hypothetical protein
MNINMNIKIKKNRSSVNWFTLDLWNGGQGLILLGVVSSDRTFRKKRCYNLNSLRPRDETFPA